MKKLSILNITVILLVASLFSGCVVGRRNVDLPIPDLGQGASKGVTVTVADPTDERQFENKPSNPSTPSIDGDVTTMSDSMKSTMIGRQRNTYGKALGDIALPEGDTVEKKMKLLIEEVFESKGYDIGEESSINVTVNIKDFWAWFTPGMWVISFEARLQSEIIIEANGKTETISVGGYGINRAQVASDANWQLAYKRAFDDFVKNFDAELENRGF